MNSISNSITSSDLWLVVISALVGYAVTQVFNFWGRRFKLDRLRKLERLEDKLERFVALERDATCAPIVLTRKIANIMRFSAYMFLAVLFVQFVTTGQSESLVIGSSAGILLGAIRELTECADFAKGLRAPEEYRNELEKEIKRLERRLSIT